MISADDHQAIADLIGRALGREGGIDKPLLRLILVPVLDHYLPDWLNTNADAIGQAVAKYVKDNAVDIKQRIVDFLEAP